MQDVTLVLWGMRKERNSASDLVDEYIERIRLAKLGFTLPQGGYPAWKLDAFVIIDAELDRLRKAEADKK